MQLRHALAKLILGHRESVVKIHGAEHLHSVRFVEKNLRWYAAKFGSNRSCCHSYKVINRAIAREYDHRSLLIRRLKSAETDVTPSYSSGHDVTFCQGSHSSFVWGCLA